MTATLKKSLGEGGAFIGDSHGDDNLHDVLTALAEGPNAVTAYQATVAAAVLTGLVAYTAQKLKSFSIAVATTGTAGSTTVELNVNGVAVAELTIANTEADGTVKHTVPTDVDVEVGDIVTIEVTAAPTAGAGLVASASLSSVSVEA